MIKATINKKAGFTIIELMLAMGFVSVLLVTIAVTVIQIANIYNRGITLKDTNLAGRSLASELQRSVNNSSQFALDANHYVQSSWGGRLCLGQYSYVWNYGEAINPSTLNPSRNIYSNSTSTIRFVKIIDPNASYCTNSIRQLDFNASAELLSSSEHDLAVHSFRIVSAASAYDAKTRQRLYNIRFSLGTNNQMALKNDTLMSKACKAPGESGSDPAYCAVNMFNIIARAGNSTE